MCYPIPSVRLAHNQVATTAIRGSICTGAAMSSSSVGWEQLNSPFFQAVARRLLDSYFAVYGFGYFSCTASGGVVYSRENVFVEISYEPETCPRYSPRILLGVGLNEYDPNWRISALPMWFLIPSDRPESKFPFWSFGTEEELAVVLMRVRRELLESYAKPLLLDPISLRRKVDAFNKGTGDVS